MRYACVRAPGFLTFAVGSQGSGEKNRLGCARNVGPGRAAHQCVVPQRKASSVEPPHFIFAWLAPHGSSTALLGACDPRMEQTHFSALRRSFAIKHASQGLEMFA